MILLKGAFSFMFPDIDALSAKFEEALGTIKQLVIVNIALSGFLIIYFWVKRK